VIPAWLYYSGHLYWGAGLGSDYCRKHGHPPSMTRTGTIVGHQLGRGWCAAPWRKRPLRHALSTRSRWTPDGPALGCRSVRQLQLSAAIDLVAQARPCAATPVRLAEVRPQAVSTRATSPSPRTGYLCALQTATEAQATPQVYACLHSRRRWHRFQRPAAPVVALEPRARSSKSTVAYVPVNADALQRHLADLVLYNHRVSGQTNWLIVYDVGNGATRSPLSQASDATAAGLTTATLQRGYARTRCLNSQLGHVEHHHVRIAVVNGLTGTGSETVLHGHLSPLTAWTFTRWCRSLPA
jgi:hypothetical protein